MKIKKSFKPLLLTVVLHKNVEIKMSVDNKFKEKYGTSTGFRVPDNFFEIKFKEISETLPEYKMPVIPKLSRWHRVRPYVYLAAMFAGIWCMMKMFHIMNDSRTMTLENVPDQVAAVMESQPEIVELYSPSDGSYEYTLERLVIDEYDDFDAFEKDFAKSLSSVEKE